MPGSQGYSQSVLLDFHQLDDAIAEQRWGEVQRLATGLGARLIETDAKLAAIHTLMVASDPVVPPTLSRAVVGLIDHWNGRGTFGSSSGSSAVPNAP